MDADGLDQMEIEVWHQEGALTIRLIQHECVKGKYH